MITQHVHDAASRGYTADADSYVRGRPDYPPELAAWLTGTLGLGSGASVVDLGAGTGKFTPRLVGRCARSPSNRSRRCVRDGTAQSIR